MPIECNVSEFKEKIENAPNLLILKAFVPAWIDKCQKINTSCPSEGNRNGGKQKTKRAPSAYNLHMKDCIPKKKKESPNMQHTEVFTACAAEYKKQKA